MRRLKHGKMSGGCGDSCCLKLEGLNVRIQGEEILEDVSFHLHCGEIINRQRLNSVLNVYN